MTNDLHNAVKAYRDGKERLISDWRETLDTDAFLKRHTELLDQAVHSLSASLSYAAQQGAAVLAIGGYGRKELYPFSDIDVLVLLDEESRANPEVVKEVEAFVQSLWEIGLPVGATVRTLKEALDEAAKDLSTATTYLETRLIRGNPILANRLVFLFKSTLDPVHFFRDKMLEKERRHQKMEDTPYALEPSVKDSPGGLRDIQLYLWCAKAAGLAQNYDDMSYAGILTSHENAALSASFSFASTIRTGIHVLTRRHEDRLRFDLQEDLAELLGITGTSTLRASEVLMKKYYVNAKGVTQLSALQEETLADIFLMEKRIVDRTPIDELFCARGEAIDIRELDEYGRHPDALLKTFLAYAQHRELKRMTTEMLRGLWYASFNIKDDFRDDPVNKQTFLEIIKLKHGAYHALKLMNMWGILGRFLPSFEHIVGQMQHDLYHIFTVDQHTLRVVRNVRRFGRSEFAHEYPKCSAVYSTLSKPWLLTLAALFHDIGKGLGGSHEVVGAEIAMKECLNLGIEKEDAEFVSFLVREHLTLSQTAQKSDISDPDVVRAFKEKVGSLERLSALYLLTVADIRATSPKVWSPWKAQLLEALYERTRDAFRGVAMDTEAAHKRKKADALALLSEVEAQSAQELWKELDLVYFMRQSADEIAWHAKELVGRTRTESPLIRVRSGETDGSIEVLIYMKDRSELFSRAVSGFGKAGLSVLDARIHTSSAGYALDTFMLSDPFQKHQDEYARRKLEEKLTKTMISTDPLADSAALKSLSRRSKSFPTRPSVSIVPTGEGASKTKALLNIVATDRIGLLYSISRVLAKFGIGIETARIATLGERAEDVFLINGIANLDDKALLSLESALVEALQAK